VTIRPRPITWPEPPVYARLQEPTKTEWQSIVDDYETAPDVLFNAWLYLTHHPAFWGIADNRTPTGSADIIVVVSGHSWYRDIELGVQPDGGIWLEIFPHLWPQDFTWDQFHKMAPGVPDWRLNIQGSTYEEAVILAASIIHNQYGNDREFLKVPELDEDRWHG